MNLLNDVITYVRRIIKSPSNAVVSDNLLIDYINRFWIMDVDARMQLFDLKNKYQFQTQPGVDKYNMPLYSVQTQPGAQTIGMYPVYQGFLGPAYINGVEVAFQTQQEPFFNSYPNISQSLRVVGVGNGTAGPYNISFPILPPTPPVNPPFNGILRGHVDITGIISLGNLGFNGDPPIVSSLNASTTIPGVPTTSVDANVFITSLDGTGANVVVTDSGQFLSGNVNYGLLIAPGQAPNGNSVLPAPVSGPRYSTTSNTINYFSGACNVIFPVAIPPGVNINAQCFFFQSGLPRTVLYYNNTITLRTPPDSQYLVELDGYLSPAAFLNTAGAIPFGYMAEYLARGAARKILSDTGDIEQFQFYEPLFKEQELLVWKRSQRQWTSSRTETIYSQGNYNGQWGNNGIGGGVL